MSATSSTTQPISTTSGNVVTALPAVEIDASCRLPVMLLLVSSAVWLFLASVFGILASMTFHKASMVGDAAWLSYGRMHPVALDALVYGFAIQAGLGVGLWVLSHLAGTRLALGPIAVFGGIVWNLGVALGIAGIFSGANSGYEWLEFPRYASGLLFFAYVAIGLAGVVTFQFFRQREVYISEWLFVAALLWFPWIYSTAQILLLVHPVRGVMQAVIDWWYINNVTTVWVGFIGVAAAFYFVPKLTGRPLYSHYLGVVIFWILAFFGSWGAIPDASPLPRWIPALSSAAAMISLVAVAGVAVNVWKSICGNAPKNDSAVLLKFISFGVFAYVVASVAGAVASYWKVSEVLNFTLFLPAQTHLMLYGFFTMTMFGAAYYIVPRLFGVEICPRRIKATFWLAAVGVLLYVIALGVGGIQQGGKLNNPNSTASIMDVVKGILMFIRMSTLGDLLMAIANLIFLVNLIGVLMHLGRNARASIIDANTKKAGVRA
jgi:cytochrome c oxidase cbb3-type subunit I